MSTEEQAITGAWGINHNPAQQGLKGIGANLQACQRFLFCRVMYGEVLVTGMDWLPQSGPGAKKGELKPAKVAIEKALTVKSL